jgi:hypothetical protein
MGLPGLGMRYVAAGFFEIIEKERVMEERIDSKVLA